MRDASTPARRAHHTRLRQVRSPRSTHVNYSELTRMNNLSQPTERLLSFFHRFSLARWAPIPLRLIVGFGFMQHGFSKVSRGPDVFAGILHTLGVPAPHLMAWLTILTELAGGFAVLVGAVVSLVSLPMVVVLLVATFSTQLRYGFSSVKLVAVTAGAAQFGPPGYEVNLLYIACLAALVLRGPGPFSVDGWIRKRMTIANPPSRQ